MDVTTEAKKEVDEHSQKLKKDESVKVSDLVDRLRKVEEENVQLKSLLVALETRLAKMEVSGCQPAAALAASVPKPAAAAAAPKPAAPAPAPAKKEEAEDDDFDMFGDDDEDPAEKERIKEERLKAYNEKKAKKPALVAKSSVLLDVKVWDDETDMKALEQSVRSIVVDGLIWGSSKLIPVAFGVKKLQIQCVIEDDKVNMNKMKFSIVKLLRFIIK